MPYLVHCRVLEVLGCHLLGLGDVRVCVPSVAVTSMLSPCCCLHLLGGGKGGFLRLGDEPDGNEQL